MRILHTSDWHLGKSLYDFSLLDDQSAFIDGLIGLITDRRADAVLIAGDIYDRPLPPAPAIQLYDRFLSTVVMKLGVPVVAIAGNHDSASRLEFGSSLYQASGYYIYGYAKKDIPPVVLHDRHGDVAFYPVPYLHPADVRVLFDNPDTRTCDQAYRVLFAHNRERIDPGTRNVALAHGYFSDLSGIPGAEKELVTSDSEINIGGMDIADASCFAPFDYAALGHLHAPQWAVGERVRYSGSPLKYSLSEERHRKSVTLVELGEKGEAAWEIAEIPAGRDVRTVRGSFARLCDPSFHTSGSFDDYVFAEIGGDAVTYPMEKLRVLFPNILGVAFTEALLSSPQLTAVDSRNRPSPEELFSRFYRETKGEDIPPDRLDLLREAVRETLEADEADNEFSKA